MKARIKLHIGMATIYTLTTLVLVGTVIGYLFYSTSQLAVDTASKSMRDAAQDVLRSVDSLFLPAVRTIQSAALLLENEDLELQTQEDQKFLYYKLQTMPEVAGVFAGFQETGDFFQITRGPQDTETLLLRETVPGAAKLKQRQFQTWGGFSQPEWVLDGYDPRTRPWFLDAVKNMGPTISDPYTFASTGKLGLTISAPARAADGTAFAVVGADITLDGLAAYLEEKSVGENGRTFIFDQQGKLIVVSQEDTLNDPDHFHIDRQSVDAAIEHYQTTAEVRFRLTGTRPILATFEPFPGGFDKRWTIGVLADGTELTAGIVRTTKRTLFVALAYAALAIVLMVLLSKTITRSLRDVTQETRRIGDMQLDTDFELNSYISEIDELSQSISRMKSGLQSFGAFVPVPLVKSILKSGKGVQIDGQTQEVSLMFSDIEGFSKKSEHLTPTDVFADLSRYFGLMSETIETHNGTVDKFIGDAVMAFWNAPQEVLDHPIHACRAALECRDAVVGFVVPEGKTNSLFPVRTRFGLHTGRVIVGNVGSDSRLQYTALGAEVNLASRLEALNKAYGTTILASEAFIQKTNDRFFVRLVDLTLPSGTSQPIKVFEVIAERGAQDDEARDVSLTEFCDQWESCMALYFDMRWHEAVQAFKVFQLNHPQDHLVEIFLARCERFSITPPKADWNGVYVQTSK